MGMTRLEVMSGGRKVGGDGKGGVELRVEKNGGGRKEKLQRDDILNKQISPGIVNVLGKVQLFRRATSCRPPVGANVQISSTLGSLSFSLPPPPTMQTPRPLSPSFLSSIPTQTWLHIHLIDSLRSGESIVAISRICRSLVAANGSQTYQHQHSYPKVYVRSRTLPLLSGRMRSFSIMTIDS